METDELVSQEFIWRLDHQERLEILLLVVEGRVGLDGALMVALGVRASKAVCGLHGLSVLALVAGQSILQEVHEQEGLQLDQDRLNCVGRGPTLIDLFLSGIEDIETNASATWYIGMNDGREEPYGGWRHGVVLWECDFNVEDTALEG